MLILFSLNIINSIARLLIYGYCYSLEKLRQTTNIISTFLDLLGFIFIIITFVYYFNRKQNCFDDNKYTTILIFNFVLLGIIILSKKILKLLLIAISFPILVCLFLRDPNEFYSHFGIDPEIIRNLPSIPATENYCDTCVICAEDIKIGEDIIILNCSGHHFFHSNCIKDWLNVKLTCHVCRSENVI